MTKVTKVAQSSSSCSGSHKANKLRLWHLSPLETHTSVIPCSGVACKKVLHAAHTAKLHLRRLTLAHAFRHPADREAPKKRSRSVRERMCGATVVFSARLYRMKGSMEERRVG